MSYHSAPAQRVPAWKRLGLKLSGAASGESPIAADGTIANSSAGHGSPASAFKRKLPLSASHSPNASYASTPNKRFRTDDHTPGSHSNGRGTPLSEGRHKSVSFADNTKVTFATDKAPDAKKKKPKKPKKKKEAPAVAPPKPDFDLTPALEYLRQWHTAREGWKFNKNHQTLLIKNLFESEKIPSADILVFYLYIRELKGGVRSRLREAAEEIKKKDMEQGADAFTGEDKADKQKTYEELVRAFVKQQQERRRAVEGSSTANGNGKRNFDEVELVLRASADPEVKNRILKRIRAGMVLEELSDSESTASAETTTTTSSSSSSGQEAPPSRSPAASAPAPARVSAAAPAPAVAPATRNGATQPAKRQRLRNMRTTRADLDSSSESGSSDEDDDSTSSSSSSDDDSEDEEMVQAPTAETSSSSSSSSESQSESGEADEESGEGSDSSDDSDDE
ncbi:hypothetical protein B0T25DRAFT_77850 [Lasiosphaeria hispida]|uniref:WKF domain-containing protein n=1 Tax=Lasiosphaeria hispida TaxID=260671 RepID=A0AAJ0HP35_9PEZI|nr:hypothetical protein B0T25DRAFT_77850 [Lasiosphaeria hispida]